MFHLNIKAIMLARGIKPIPSFLRQGGFTYNRAVYLLSDKVRSIGFKDLERLCFLLHCTPFELLKIKQAADLPAEHPLQAWVAEPSTGGVASLLRGLPPEKLKEAEEMIKKLGEKIDE